MTSPLREMPTGLEAIEDAIVGALATDTTIAAYAREVSSWQGTLEAAVGQQAFRDPAMLVLFAGGPLDRRGGHDRMLLEWQVLVRDRNLRRNSARRGSAATGETGTYQMVQDVLRVLANFDLDLEGVDGLRAASVDLLQSGRDPSKTTSAYLVTFIAWADLLAVAPGQALTDITTTYPLLNS